jgi:hypothetical protein
VHLGTGTVEVTDDGGHTSLVAHGGSQVDGLLGVILGEAVRNRVSVYEVQVLIRNFFFRDSGKEHSRLNLTAVTGSALARQVGQGACKEKSVCCTMVVEFCRRDEKRYHEPWRGASNLR